MSSRPKTRRSDSQNSVDSSGTDRKRKADPQIAASATANGSHNNKDAESRSGRTSSKRLKISISKPAPASNEATGKPRADRGQGNQRAGEKIDEARQVTNNESTNDITVSYKSCKSYYVIYSWFASHRLVKQPLLSRTG
jgi:hypothetical protein